MHFEIGRQEKRGARNKISYKITLLIISTEEQCLFFSGNSLVKQPGPTHPGTVPAAAFALSDSSPWEQPGLQGAALQPPGLAFSVVIDGRSFCRGREAGKGVRWEDAASQTGGRQEKQISNQKHQDRVKPVKGLL